MKQETINTIFITLWCYNLFLLLLFWIMISNVKTAGPGSGSYDFRWGVLVFIPFIGIIFTLVLYLIWFVIKVIKIIRKKCNNKKKM